MNSSIPNFDDKIRLVIGNLLSKADTVSKSVLSAFDSSKDLNVNKGVLGGSRFNATALDTCAQFLNIPLVDNDDNRLFTNKPSLAKRIILEIQSLYPAICGDCNEEYSIEFDPDAEPTLRCFLCFQGCHNCSAYTPPENFASLPPGTVWLCKSCHNLNNPIQRKKPKSKSVSKTGSKAPTVSNTPVETPPQVNFATEELSAKLSQIKKQQEHEEQQQQTSSQTSSQNITDICEKFIVGKCPHGVTGKTVHNGRACEKLHPKWCYRFARNGKHKKYGCMKGDKCTYYHRKHCPSSVANKTCFSKDCTLLHLVGTRRWKPQPQEEVSYRRPDARGTQSSDSRNRPPKVPPRQNTESRRDSPQTEALQDIGNFLELRSLLTSLQDKFQKEIQS